MPRKVNFRDFVQIREVRLSSEANSTVYFDLIVGPITIPSCLYVIGKGSIQMPWLQKKNKRVLIKSSWVRTLRPKIILAVEAFLGRQLKPENRFELEESNEIEETESSE
jgi:hypothetical protein